jgi:hypothetical protein
MKTITIQIIHQIISDAFDICRSNKDYKFKNYHDAYNLAIKKAGFENVDDYKTRMEPIYHAHLEKRVKMYYLTNHPCKN